MRLSLICPTIGRDPVPLLKSVLPQLKGGDEFLVIADGPIPEETAEVWRLARRLHNGIEFIPLPIRIGDYGCTPCDIGMGIAKGDAVFFIGDDDRVDKNAFAHIRAALTKQPDQPHVFSMWHGGLGYILRNSLAMCQVSGQQIVIPRDMSKMPKMADVNKEQWLVSDWVFINKVHEAWGGTTVFHDEVIAYLDKQNFGEKP